MIANLLKIFALALVVVVAAGSLYSYATTRNENFIADTAADTEDGLLIQVPFRPVGENKDGTGGEFEYTFCLRGKFDAIEKAHVTLTVPTGQSVKLPLSVRQLNSTCQHSTNSGLCAFTGIERTLNMDLTNVDKFELLVLLKVNEYGITRSYNRLIRYNRK